MTALHRPEAPSARVELAAVVLVAWVLLAGAGLARNELSISWDMLNHHVYLGWEAARPRFDLDVMPAASQTFQYPYLYWPVYELTRLGASGGVAAAVLATLYLVIVPPVWLAARACIPQRGWYETAMRVLAVACAMASGAILSLFDTTTNDVLASAPLLWAMVLAFEPVAREASSSTRRIALSGLLAGVSVACKWSNGPLALTLVLLWALAPAPTLAGRARAIVIGGMSTLAGFVLAYGPWGWQLWTHYGNPFYPLFENWFAPVRAAVGWQG